jgi:hypothetical protein
MLRLFSTRGRLTTVVHNHQQHFSENPAGIRVRISHQYEHIFAPW